MTMFVTDDLGTTIIMFAMGFVMLLVACPKIRYLLLTALGAAVAVVGFILIKPKAARVKAWLNLDSIQMISDIRSRKRFTLSGRAASSEKDLEKHTENGLCTGVTE